MVGGALIQDIVQLNCSGNFCYLFLEETEHLRVPGVKAKDRWQLIGTVGDCLAISSFLCN
jgi:lipid-A-disaccharide synthase-like uncharacterized protein